MSDERQQERPPVTLEQLLQLKRAERPKAGFWEDFDRELHRRQLAAVVARRPWFARLGKGVLVGLRHAAPFAGAATAVVVIGGFLLRQHTGKLTSPDAPPPVTVTQTTTDSATPPSAEMAAEMAEPAEAAPETVAFVAPPPPQLAASETHAVVQEFALSRAPSPNFVAVTSPLTFSASDVDDDLRTVPTLTLSHGTEYRTSAPSAAGRF